MTNVEQRTYWDGPGGEHWVAEQERYDRMVEAFGDRLVAAAAPEPGERFLDVGCGNGALALAVAERVGPNGRVLGVDVSRPMLATARRRAEEAGLDNVSFEHGDVQAHAFEQEAYDAVVSRFGVMFFDDPRAAFANLATAGRGGGRLAFMCWQDMFRNDWISVPVMAALPHIPMPPLPEPGAPGPFSLADPDRVREILSAAGWGDITIDEVEEQMRLGSSVDDTVEFFKGTEMAGALMGEASEEQVAAAWDAVAEAIAPHAHSDGVVLPGRAWVVTARRPA